MWILRHEEISSFNVKRNFLWSNLYIGHRLLNSISYNTKYKIVKLYKIFGLGWNSVLVIKINSYFEWKYHPNWIFIRCIVSQVYTTKLWYQWKNIEIYFGGWALNGGQLFPFLFFSISLWANKFFIEICIISN